MNNQRNNNLQENEDFLLYFKINENKEVYLEVTPEMTFKQIIVELKKKFVWMENMEIKEFKYNGRKLFMSSNCERNEVPKNAHIQIIFSNNY